MKLSDAFLLGIAEIRYDPGTWISFRPDGSCGGCLIGAALFADGDRIYSGNITAQIEHHWPWTANLRGRFKCPFCPERVKLKDDYGIASLFTHLSHHYSGGTVSSEEIAAWLRSFEPPEHEEIAIETPEDVHAHTRPRT